MRTRWILTTSAVAGTVVALVSVCLVVIQPVPAPTSAVSPTSPTQTATAEVSPQAEITAVDALQVYSNNIENLVTNGSGGECEPVTVSDHLSSMLVDSAGATAAAGIEPPDLLLLQQVSGAEQAQEYADELSRRFDLPVGTYRALVAWAEPEEWGSTHHCADDSLARTKSVQTNAILYDSRTLALIGSPVTWSAGWLAPGRAYAAGKGCTTYQPPSVDTGTRANRWKRTTAIAARFTVVGTDVEVFAASMHLPKQNLKHACAGDGDVGVSGTGIRLSAQAQQLLTGSAIRAIGVDANRTGIASDALHSYGVTGYGSSATVGRRTQIDYLFLRGEVDSSDIDHTVDGTRSNHRALYGFIRLN